MSNILPAPKPTDGPFFVGFFRKPPKKWIRFLLVLSFSFIAGMGLASFLVSSQTVEAGNGGFKGGQQFRFEETAIFQLNPYPVLRVPAKDGDPARTFMVAGQGKRGVQQQGAKLDGATIMAAGLPIERGDLQMIQLRGGKNGLREADAPLNGFTPAAPVSLGKWRLTGEICDGKCYSGAMRPGRGLAHKACANLCLNGGVPPVFVSTAPVEGSTFFLVTDQDGNPLGERVSPMVALWVEAEGEVERLDDLLIFKMDLDSVKVTP